MNFDAFIAAAWKDHAERPEAVAARLADALDRPGSASEIAAFASLVTHVYGEHLARWSEGVGLLEALCGRPAADGSPDASRAIARGVAILRYAGALDSSLSSLPAGDRVAVLATASSALAAQREWARAIAAYEDALRLAAPGLDPGSPATRALAIAGNNLAASLEEKRDRDPLETRGMIVAAEGGLRYWRQAGAWLEEERAEYRLARSLLQAGEGASAAAHARRCVELCIANDAPPFERFFGHAALAFALRHDGDHAAAAAARRQALEQYALIAPGDRPWCTADVEALGT
jgi:hypothetical protein